MRYGRGGGIYGQVECVGGQVAMAFVEKNSRPVSVLDLSMSGPSAIRCLKSHPSLLEESNGGWSVRDGSFELFEVPSLLKPPKAKGCSYRERKPLLTRCLGTNM